MKKYISFFFLMVLILFNVEMQAQRCGTMAFDSIRREKYSLPSLEDFENRMTEKMTQDTRLKSAQIYRIPVVVHVVHNGENPGEGANKCICGPVNQNVVCRIPTACG